MIIALTGTPGTGKTSISDILSLQYGLSTLNIHTFAKEQQIIEGVDKKRKSDIIDIEMLDERIKKQVTNSSLIVLDGHLSHLLTCVSKVIVLRCHPVVLMKRLKEKKWKDEKIKENIEAEILDLIEVEAVDIHTIEDVIEIDTTQMSKNDVAETIYKMISSKFVDTKIYRPGSKDWSELLLSDTFRWIRN